jgi:ribosome-binding factor A
MTSSRRYPRTARLNEVMLEVLADELERLSDPRLGFVTFTGVDVNRDLSRATVYYSTLGGTSGAMAETKPESTAAALDSAAPHLRRVLGREVRVKNVPKLVFAEDPGITGGARIESILRDIHEREASSGRAVRPSDDVSPGDDVDGDGGEVGG